MDADVSNEDQRDAEESPVDGSRPDSNNPGTTSASSDDAVDDARMVVDGSGLSRKLSPEAKSALDAAVEVYSEKLETQARILAGKSETILQKDIEHAEERLRIMSSSSAITVAVAWLRPLAFLFVGLGLPAVWASAAGKPSDFAQLMALLGACFLIVLTVMLDSRSVRFRVQIALRHLGKLGMARDLKEK